MTDNSEKEGIKKNNDDILENTNKIQYSQNKK